MTATARFDPGEGVAYVGPSAVLFTSSRDERLGEAGSLTIRGAGVDAVLDALLAVGLRSVGSFALLLAEGDHQWRAVLRGSSIARARSDGSTTTLRAEGYSTWHEHLISGETVELSDAEDEVPGGSTPAFWVSVGVVPASRLVLGATNAGPGPVGAVPSDESPDEVVAHAPDAGPYTPLAGASETKVHESSDDDAYVQHPTLASRDPSAQPATRSSTSPQPVVPAPAAPAPASPPDPFTQPAPPAERPVPAEPPPPVPAPVPPEPPAPPEPPVPPDPVTPVLDPEWADLIDNTHRNDWDGSVSEPASVPISSVPEMGAQNSDGESFDAEGSDGETDLGFDPDVDGMTVARPRAARPATRAVPSVPPGYIGATVHAVQCPSGHLTPPQAPRCRVCGVGVSATQTHTVPRPQLGELRFTDGDVVPLDHPVFVGRLGGEPSETSSQEEWNIHHVPSGNKEVSRRHMEVRLRDWQVVAVDLGSSNGTLVQRPGESQFRLTPNLPEPLVPGTVVTLSDEISFTYEV